MADPPAGSFWLLASLRVLFVVTSLSSASAQPQVRVAVVQLTSAHAGDFPLLRGYAQRAKSAGAQLIVFPEAADMGWLNPDAFYRAAPVPGAVTDSFAEIAKSAGIFVATGITERGDQVSATPAIYLAYDAAVLIDPRGRIILHHRKYNVLKNAFASCPVTFGTQGCSYTPGALEATRVVQTPFGMVGLLVCADAYTYEPSSLNTLAALHPTLVVVPWGVTTSTHQQCGQEGFNATAYAAAAAARLQGAYVVGANATGQRPYGRFLPSWYCGTSGYATPDGKVGSEIGVDDEIGYFDIPTAR